MTNRLRIPTSHEYHLAELYLRDTDGHSCDLCMDSDCAISSKRFEAAMVTRAFHNLRPLRPSVYWPMQEA